MANLSGYQLTESGRALLAKTASGVCTLKFTKVKFGEAETTLNDLLTKTDLIGTSLKQVDIVGATATQNIITVIATVTNIDQENNFLIRQVGVFAEGVAATSPASGVTPEAVPETLFAVAYDTLPDIIPAKNTSISFTKQFNINLVVSNASNCQVTFTPTGVVTKQILDLHNDDEEVHPNLIKRLFGSASATLQNVKNSIQNWCKETIALLFGITSATTDNIKTKVKEWAQEQIETWLESQGIRYNIAQNGYICLGHFFGDAIIQWGVISTYNSGTSITINSAISYNKILVGFTNIAISYNSWKDNGFINLFASYIGDTIQHNLNNLKLNIYYFVICQ